LLFFNGIGANLELVAGLAAELSTYGIGIVIFDVPGTGGSSATSSPYRFSWLAELAAEVLRGLGIESQIDVLGVSWGGALAQEFTRRYSGRVRRLLLAATTAGAVSVPGRWSALSKMLSVRRYADRGYLARIAGELYGGKARADAKVLEQFGNSLRSPRGTGYYFQMLAGIGWTSAHWLHTLRQPTLVMMGSDDPIIPLANGRLLVKLLPNAHLVTIADGHLFLLTSARECAAMIADFLGKQEWPRERAAPSAAR
jgi:poly(3-hydroxyalkanoate) depolymerase